MLMTSQALAAYMTSLDHSQSLADKLLTDTTAWLAKTFRFVAGFVSLVSCQSDFKADYR